MDAIRRQQIDEVLNNERDVNKIVFSIEKRNVELSTDNVLPYTQLNSEAINAVGSVVNQLLILLEKKKSDIMIVATDRQQNGRYTMKANDTVHTVVLFEDVLQLYNTAVEPYMGLKSSLTQ